MRVVVVSAWEPWRRPDAANLVLREQLRRLGRRHDITVLAAGAGQRVAAVPDVARQELPGVAITWFGTDRSPGADLAERWAWSWRHLEPAHVAYVARPPLLAELHARLDGADLVHLHGWGTAGLWQQAAGLPTVHMAVDPWGRNVGNRRVSVALRSAGIGQRALIGRHERLHYPKHRAVIVVANHDAAELRRLAPDATLAVLPNGVELGPEPAAMPSVSTLGFHGAFESQANVDAARHLVDRVLPRVRASVPDVRVLLAGRQPPAEVRRLASSTVTVRADVTDLREVLDATTVHVDWFSSGTGLKNKVLEAMAAGRPVVANRLGAAGVGAGGGVAVAADVDDAARRITRLLHDPGAAVAVGNEGRKRVAAEFSWDTNVDRLEEIWQRAVAR